MKTLRVCILRIEGTNCEAEMFSAFKGAGMDPELVHLKQLTGDALPRRALEDYDCLMIPGGFSSGDYVRAGAIFAARMKCKLRESILNFLDGGGLIGGVCNGFQVLVELGLLPGFDDLISDEPQMALHINDSNRFECRLSFLRHELEEGTSPFTSRIKKGAILRIPSAHAEGKVVFPEEFQKEYLEKMRNNNQIIFRYVNPDGGDATHPWNPNGSVEDIAAISNPKGNVFGMMPHPERVFNACNDPMVKRGELKEYGDGRAIFDSIFEYLSTYRSKQLF
ncbi:MAG: Phosphoribosylformylglycinamidine synthase I [Candidatus Syntrophoarchaeum caldarius]|uniref:Phosphoribosylformylglycinamidine synthase subunit PurQ n=1 Tax=Candidatus Syntropharchaeum caldarium TaxID=1838285 RepID=A0A1F2P7V3_9EURY|nr:MAG: Phosphoribosylformylglycinamidine synthase I [Candidatus Syntrophoarchaeum caldarius]